MEKSWNQDPDPHNNRCGSETLISDNYSTMLCLNNCGSLLCEARVVEALGQPLETRAQVPAVPAVVLPVIENYRWAKWRHKAFLFGRTTVVKYVYCLAGESNSPRFYHFCVPQLMQFSLFQSHSRFFSFYIYLVAFYPSLGEAKKSRKRKELK